jgi:hypothetical protein
MLYSTKCESIWIKNIFKSGGAASPKGKRIVLVLAPKWRHLEWSGSKFYEHSCWILLIDPSAQISYMIDGLKETVSKMI